MISASGGRTRHRRLRKKTARGDELHFDSNPLKKKRQVNHITAMKGCGVQCRSVSGHRCQTASLGELQSTPAAWRCESAGVKSGDGVDSSQLLTTATKSVGFLKKIENRIENDRQP